MDKWARLPLPRWAPAAGRRRHRSACARARSAV